DRWSYIQDRQCPDSCPNTDYPEDSHEFAARLPEWQDRRTDNLVALHFKYDQARRRFVEWAQNEIAVVPDFHKRILFSDEAHFWLNGYVNKQNCRIWSEANPQVSCDLTPLDYFLWGYVKSLVYADKPETLDNLKDNIRRVIADTRPQMLEKVIENWTSRLDYIRASRGSHMPEIIFKM
ncbi:uncharacterized protein TNCV_1784831, partial [Trichonephila clavipes]